MRCGSDGWLTGFGGEAAASLGDGSLLVHRGLEQSRSRRVPVDHVGIAPPVKVLVWPQCGEAVAVWSPVRREDVAESAERALRSAVVDDASSVVDEDDRVLDDESVEANRQRAVRRARTRFRRFCVANRLTRMWVLTFAGEGLHGPDGLERAKRCVRAFIRRMRRTLMRDRPFPYAYSFEPHPKGHGWHVNLFLAPVFVEKRHVQRVWGHGNVWFTDFERDSEDWLGRRIGGEVRAGGGGARSARNARRASRRAASYGSKYATKVWNDPSVFPPGVHRYEVAEGFAPRRQEVRVQDFSEAAAVVVSHPSFGELLWRMSSDDWVDHDGPACMVWMFDAPQRESRRRRRRCGQ